MTYTKITSFGSKDGYFKFMNDATSDNEITWQAGL